MTTTRRLSSVVVVASALALPYATSRAVAAAKPQASGVHGNLVTAGWLHEHLDDPGVLVLDASAAQAYAEKHIRRAVSVDYYMYGVQDSPPADVQQRLRSWGVSPGKKVVIYDQGGGMTATRIFFTLEYHGYPARDLFLLDGGLAKWQADGLPVTKDVAPVAPGSFRVTKVDESVRVRLPEVLTATGDPSGTALVEALGPEWHFGQVAPFGRGGHIPHGILLPSADFYEPDKTFKSAGEIRRMLDYVGIRPDQPVYTYCGGGVAASVAFFAIKHLARQPEVKMYVESEKGWLSDDRGLPYWTYDAPFLMRDASWLQWRTSKMIRTYAGSTVSIVDVRPAEAYGRGHVPFSLDIPAEAFRAGVADPARLAAVLGPAGVDASHEAVIVSGAGLTREAALAFVMLRELGQKRVSLLTTSLDDWAKLGSALDRDATPVGPRRGPLDVTIAPTDYPASVRKGVLIADANATKGLYPKVFVASGQKLPAKALAGTVVHVPYTDLLDGRGNPKEAKEIWAILTKAGVPRYAELVCVSDDPGEAAANYFVLELMGFPDVKVLAI